MIFKFNEFSTNLYISREIPGINKIAGDLNVSSDNILIVADENTFPIAEKIISDNNVSVCVLKSGEENKNWQSVEKVLKAAKDANLGRDCLFLGVGGGVIGDLCAFAASVYMRGCRLALTATTLLAMVDSSVGGKTGFDLFGIKNLAGTFYPAQAVYMPLDSLASLPYKEWKNGYAELIKTAVLEGDDFLEQAAGSADGIDIKKLLNSDLLCELIKKAVQFKAGIASEDLLETGRRKLLNLGHTFAHALESAAGFENISHGEAVAWGMVQACSLGRALGITPAERADKIKNIILSFGYECACPHPLAEDTDVLLNAMKSDKKKAKNMLTFIVPDAESARAVNLKTQDDEKLLMDILTGCKI